MHVWMYMWEYLYVYVFIVGKDTRYSEEWYVAIYNDVTWVVSMREKWLEKHRPLCL